MSISMVVYGQLKSIKEVQSSQRDTIRNRNVGQGHREEDTMTERLNKYTER